MSNMPAIQIDQAIKSIRSLARRANSIASEEFNRSVEPNKFPDPHESRFEEIGEAIESAFVQLLTLSEALQLQTLNKTILDTFGNAKRIGLSKCDNFEDVSGWSYWAGTVEKFADSIDASFGSAHQPTQGVNAYLLSVLQGLQSAITDKRCFDAPGNEDDVHNRSEMVLRCIFPDLIRKPPLAKSVKGFIPDSGIPSLSTFIEYKFLSTAEQAGAVADEILADTRGYQASAWANIVFVIYETKRFKRVQEWRDLLRQCGIPESVQLILLHGEEPPSTMANKSPKTSAKPKTANPKARPKSKTTTSKNHS